MATSTSGWSNLAPACRLSKSRSTPQPVVKQQKLACQTRGFGLQLSPHCHRLHVVAGATESSQQTPASAENLKAELQDAIRLEAYSRAAEIRDALKTLQTSDPTLLKEQLEECIAQERYEDAAQLRDKLRHLVQQQLEDAREKTTSDTVTEGIRVQVKSYFVPSHSDVRNQRLYFTYNVKITNNSSNTMQLLNRHWVITNAHGAKQEIRGTGVVGETPILKPGQTFEYNSACPLATETGTMEGEYGMMRVDPDSPTDKPSDEISIVIGKFALDTQVIVMI